MFTETVQSEKKFYAELIENQDTEMKVGDTVVVRKCPKCHTGNVLTRCIHSVSNGDGFWEFEHCCDSCGEKFIPGSLWSDIFFHEPYEMLREIDSPFGKLSVTINGVSVPFQCRTRYFELQEYEKSMNDLNVAIKLGLKPEECASLQEKLVKKFGMNM